MQAILAKLCSIVYNIYPYPNLHRGSPSLQNLKFKFNVAMTFRHPVILVVWQSFPIEEVVSVGKFLLTFRRWRHGQARSYGLSKIAAAVRCSYARIVCHQPITRPAIHRDPRAIPEFPTANERVKAAWRDFYRARLHCCCCCSSEPSPAAPHGLSYTQLSHSLVSEQT